MNNHEPLAPDPKWKQVNSPQWISSVKGGALDTPPQAYALGFDDGAYAMAAKVLHLMQADQMELIRLLLRYEKCLAVPIKGWTNSPPKP